MAPAHDASTGHYQIHLAGTTPSAIRRSEIGMLEVNVGGTSLRIDGDLNPAVPLVILLHGTGGTGLDMTDPANPTARPGLAFDRTAAFPVWKDEGFFHLTPPLTPASGFFTDPPAGPLTSWRDALNAAGFSTLSYSQVSASGLLAPAVAELNRIAAGFLLTDPRVSGLRLAFVAHSRGGLLARQFLVGAVPALVARVDALVTLHSPHLGSGIASAVVAVDTTAAALQTAFTSAGVTPPGLLAMLRTLTTSAALPEMAVGSPTLAAIAAGEPVAGVSYHTFGGTSTVALRLWANVYGSSNLTGMSLSAEHGV